MPKFDTPWDETKPAGSRSKLLGDDDIREFKKQMRQRLGEDHVFDQNESDDAFVGFHKKVSLINQADPTSLADGAILYAKDNGTYSELHVLHENAGSIQLTRLGKLLISSLGIASEAKGDLIVRGTSAWERRALGTALQQIRVNAGATDLEYFTPTTIAAASQAEQEAASLTSVFTSPGTQKYHPGTAKAWVKFAGSDGSILASHNIASVVKNSTGNYTITFTTAFSSEHYSISGTLTKTAGSSLGSFQPDYTILPTVTAVNIWTQKIDSGGGGFGVYDPTHVFLSFFGDQS